jgi:putative effector of murein hydrolase
MAVSDSVHAQRDLAALFAIATGTCGVLFGEVMLKVSSLKARISSGALFGAGAQSAGAAKARELGREEGAIASLTMVIAGIVMVVLAPLFNLFPL